MHDGQKPKPSRRELYRGAQHAAMKLTPEEGKAIVALRSLIATLKRSRALVSTAAVKKTADTFCSAESDYR
jgi:hypothetical protein